MEHDVIFTISALATIIGVVVAVIALSLSYRKFLQSKDAEKKRASESLYTELKDAFEGLDDEKFPNSVLHVVITKDDDTTEILYLMNRTLNHDFYDSLIFSGQINFLEPKLQQPIQDLFKLIKMHNECMMRIGQSMAQDGTNAIPKSAYKYCKWVDENEPRLKMSIQSMMGELKRHFKIDPESSA